jgi:predicted secreted Zn-dependent protease
MLPTDQNCPFPPRARHAASFAWLKRAAAACLIGSLLAGSGAPATLADVAAAEPAAAPELAANTADLVLAGPGVQIATSTTYYQVDGSTWDAVADSLRAAASGEWAAQTTWQFSTSYPYDTAGRVCRAGPVSVLATINYRLPSWTASADAPQDLIDTWSRFSDGVRVHESGHRDIAVAAAVALADALRSLPAQPSCAEFEQVARSTTADLMRQLDRDQVAYDLQTQHGLTQGAVFR